MEPQKSIGNCSSPDIQNVQSCLKGMKCRVWGVYDSGLNYVCRLFAYVVIFVGLRNQQVASAEGVTASSSRIGTTLQPQALNVKP